MINEFFNESLFSLMNKLIWLNQLFKLFAIIWDIKISFKNFSRTDNDVDVTISN